MQNVVGVRIKTTGRVYDFDPNGLELKAGDLVVIDSEKGLCIGEVVRERYEVDLAQPCKKVIRKASEDDLKKVEENKELKKEASEYCLTRIKEMGLPMKLVGTELSFDGSKAIFYFTSEGRVDFRELVKDLAAKFRIRIEMKQIGVRDEARLIGGYGCCGRALCCETFIKDFEPVSIKMAKKQELALNPAKISGVCGRLMCCLVFEYDIYDEIKKDTNELRNIEKIPLPEENQTSLSPSTGSDSATSMASESSSANLRVQTSNEISGGQQTMESGRSIKEGSIETKICSTRRKRRRRRRRPERNNSLQK